jgi:serine/threonine protein kinase
VIKQVGEGAFAKAYMAVEKNTSFLCVLKVISKQKLE